MTDSEWTIFERQGSREVWQKVVSKASGETETYYRGEEFTEIEGKSQKVEETRIFENQSAALAWLNGLTD